MSTEITGSYPIRGLEKMKVVWGLCVLLFLLVAACDLFDLEDCPVNCETKVVDTAGNAIECHCPND